MNKQRIHGFTLIEILIAIAVFAVMSAMAYGGLNSVMKQRAGLEEHANRLANLQKTFTIIERDILQIVNRGIRDQYGDTKKALVAHDYEDIKLELTRTGWRNPFPNEKRVRSVLQRVGYTVKDQQLIRQYWFELDRGYESKPFESVLLEDIKGFELRFLDAKKQWQAQWPKLNAKEVLPLAIEVTIESDRLGRISRLFQVSSSSL